MQIPAGILSDRWGSRNTIASFLLIGAAGSLLFALSGSVTAATVGRVLIGVGMGMVFVPALRVILYWFPPARHALGRA
ncbi:MAG: MFS transporter [Bilophila wadsworthia]